MHNNTETDDDMDLLSIQSDTCDDGDSVTLGSDSELHRTGSNDNMDYLLITWND
jgi:hypothetical protein